MRVVLSHVYQDQAQKDAEAARLSEESQRRDSHVELTRYQTQIDELQRERDQLRDGWNDERQSTEHRISMGQMQLVRATHLPDTTRIGVVQDQLTKRLDEALKTNADLQQQISHLQFASQRKEGRQRSSVDGRSEMELELARVTKALRDAEEKIKMLEEGSWTQPAENRGMPKNGK